MQGNLHYTCRQSCNVPLRNVCVVTSKDIWYQHHELVHRCALTEPICAIRKWCHSRNYNKLVRIRYDNETEPSGHFLTSVRMLHNLTMDMNSSRQLSKIGHIVWTATCYMILLEVYVKCVFHARNKVADEVGKKICHTSTEVHESPQMKCEEKIPREYIVWWQYVVCVF